MKNLIVVFLLVFVIGSCSNDKPKLKVEPFNYYMFDDYNSVVKVILSLDGSIERDNSLSVESPVHSYTAAVVFDSLVYEKNMFFIDGELNGVDYYINTLDHDSTNLSPKVTQAILSKIPGNAFKDSSFTIQFYKKSQPSPDLKRIEWFYFVSIRSHQLCEMLPRNF